MGVDRAFGAKPYPTAPLTANGQRLPSRLWRYSFALVFLVLATAAGPQAQLTSRLDRIAKRGYLGCGIEAAVPGFATLDEAGRYRGLDIDVCRAVAAAIFGTPDKIRFIPAPSLDDFRRRDEIDLVSRRLTWELQREGSTGLLFGPVTFYDGQMFLAARAAGVDRETLLDSTSVCVAGGTVFERQLDEFFTSHSLALKKIALESPHDYADIAHRLDDGRCRVYSGDESDLGAVRASTARPENFILLPERISKEPLAPLVRDDDPRFFTVVRWTVFALIEAEELGVTAANAGAMRQAQSLDVRRLLGVVAGNGKALGLREQWAYDAIRAVGNYGEMFERNVGRDGPIKLERGLNRLWKDGGLMYAAPLR
jgi:general L-amino acid transport system substrate-binding protein